MLIQVDITRFASPHCISVVCFLHVCFVFVFRLLFFLPTLFALFFYFRLFVCFS